MMTDAEWLAERMRGITGSDIAAICGLHPHKSKYTSYAEKTGKISGPELTFAMKRGTWMEPHIAAEYAEEKNLELIKPDPRIFSNPDCEWQKGSPDYFFQGIDDGLEVKDVGHRQAWRWGTSEYGDMHPAAFLQSHWYMGVTQRPGWRVAACIAGDEIRHWRLEPDPELFGLLQEAAEQFRVDHILPDIPPPLDGHSSTVQTIRAMFPDQIGSQLREVQELNSTALQWLTAKAKIKEWEERLDTAANAIKAEIAEQEGVFGRGWRATWKQTRSSYKTDWEAIARACNPAASLIKKHTQEKPGYRRFLLKEM